MSKKNESIPEDKKPIPIRYYLPEGLATPFATNMLIQTIENEFKISFFELRPPLRLNETDPVPGEVGAYCVASVIVTADRFPKFIKAFQEQFDKYQLHKKQIK